MAFPPLASVEDLERRLGLEPGSLQGPDLARAQAALEDASALVRAEAGRDWVDEDGVTVTAPQAAVVVALQAAKRAFLNPRGFQHEQTGPFSYQVPRDQVGLMLTEAERRAVRAAAGRYGLGTFVTPSAYTDPLPFPSGTRVPASRWPWDELED